MVCLTELMCSSIVLTAPSLSLYSIAFKIALCSEMAFFVFCHIVTSLVRRRREIMVTARRLPARRIRKSSAACFFAIPLQRAAPNFCFAAVLIMKIPDGEQITTAHIYTKFIKSSVLNEDTDTSLSICRHRSVPHRKSQCVGRNFAIYFVIYSQYKFIYSVFYST